MLREFAISAACIARQIDYVPTRCAGKFGEHLQQSQALDNLARRCSPLRGLKEFGKTGFDH